MPTPYRLATYRLIAYAPRLAPRLIKFGSYDQVMARMCSSRLAETLAAEGWTAWEFKRDLFAYEH